jgi:Porin PorA
MVGLVLVALGTTLVGLAIALPSYAYPRVTKLPDDPNSTIVAVGQGVTVLKVRSDKIEPVTGTVYVTRYVTKDPLTTNRPKPPGGVAQWRLGFSANLAKPDGDLLTAYLEGYTLDEVTGEANPCCADYVQLDQNTPVVPIRHEGLGLKFPFGTQKQDYKFWDVELRRATDARFSGTEVIDGLETYKFVQDIKDQTIGTQDWPGALFKDPASASVTADEVYSTKRSLWVEPRTGAIIKGSEDVNWRYVYQGAELPRTVGTLTYDDKTVQDQVDLYKGPSSRLKLLRSTVPLVFWILGPLLALVGVVLLVLGGTDEEDELEDEPAEDGATAGV